MTFSLALFGDDDPMIRDLKSVLFHDIEYVYKYYKLNLHCI